MSCHNIIGDWGDAFEGLFESLGISRGYHTKQQAVANDTSNLRVIIGSRRSGKTELMVGEAVELADQFPGEIVPYLGPTLRGLANLVFPKVREISKRLHIDLEVSVGNYTITTPNGGTVQLFGLATLPDADKGRGFRFPGVFVDECFVAGTDVRIIGDIQCVLSRPAPSILITIDGVTSTGNHPYLTPEGWMRADEIRPDTLLCVWDPLSPDNPQCTEDVFGGVFVGVSSQDNQYSSAQAAASCHQSRSQKESPSVKTSERVRDETLSGVSPASQTRLCKIEGYRSAGPEGSGRQRPWTYRAGKASSFSDTTPNASGRSPRGRTAPVPLQIGPGVPIDQVGSGNRRIQPFGQGPPSTGQTKGNQAQWRRVVSVEIHERGGVGRYNEVCPNGLVYNLTTSSGLYFAGGRLVHNCGACRQDALKLAVVEAFGPATADFHGRGGRGITIAGTPPYRPGTYFEDLCGGNTHKSKLGASVHHMTLWDNPYFEGRADAVVQQWLENNNLTKASSQYQREWLGLFCVDTLGLCFGKWDGRMYPRSHIPLVGVTILGLDLGVVHSNAWVVVRITPEYYLSDDRKTCKVRNIIHVLESYQQGDMEIDEIAAVTRDFASNWNCGLIYADGGGGGLQTVIDLQRRHGLPLTNYKTLKGMGSKASRIWQLNSLMGNGGMVVHEDCQDLKEQLQSVPWNEDSTGYDERFPNDVLDALLYASTHDISLMTRTMAVPPKPGSPEWINMEHEADIRRMTRGY